jgi:hypothetical protein
MSVETGMAGEVTVSGRSVVTSAGEANLVRFDLGEPYATFDQSGARVFFACPLNSRTYPSAWAVDADCIALRLPASALTGGTVTTVTAVLGLTDRASSGDLEDTVLRSASESTSYAAADTDREGFLLSASPSAQEIREGEQYMTLGVYKRYQKVFGD